MSKLDERLGLTPDQRRAFDERGLVKLEGAVSLRAVGEMADRLWDEMARKDGVQRHEPATWRQERVFGFQSLQGSGAFQAMASPRVRAALDDLMGLARWAEPRDWGQPLVCFPTPGEWALPRKDWHFDGRIEPAGRRALVGRVFLILAPLEAHGGGTVVATGSHRIVMAQADAAAAPQSSAEMRRRLQRLDPWFDDLMRGAGEAERTVRFIGAETEVAGTSLRVEEMTGAPGDVWLMHAYALHAGSPNRRDAPRLALSQFVAPKP